MLSAISSGNCNIIAPVAEDLKVLNVMWDCGTEKILENKRYKYVVRTQANATTEMVATVLYLLKVRPDFKTIAVVNQDYAWGRDSWEIFLHTLKVFKPDVKVVAEMFPKLGASDFSTEISPPAGAASRRRAQHRLGRRPRHLRAPGRPARPVQAGRHLRDAAARELARAPGRRGARRHHRRRARRPLLGCTRRPRDDPKHKDFVAKFRAKTGAYPIYPTYHMAQALVGLKTGYEAAIKANGGKWPSARAGRRGHAQDEVQGLRPRDHDARGRPGPRGPAAGPDQARSEVPVRGDRQDGADPGRTGDHAGRASSRRPG